MDEGTIEYERDDFIFDNDVLLVDFLKYLNNSQFPSDFSSKDDVPLNQAWKSRMEDEPFFPTGTHIETGTNAEEEIENVE